MNKLKRYANIGWVAYTTGAFGGARLVFASLVAFLFPFQDTAISVLSDLALVLGLNLFLTIGFSTVLLKDVAKNAEFKNQLFAIHTQQSMVGVIVGILVLSLFNLAGFVHFYWQSGIVLLSVTVYQHVRHFLLAQKKYVELGLIEIAILAFICIIIPLLYFNGVAENGSISEILYSVFLAPYLLITLWAAGRLCMQKVPFNKKGLVESIDIGISTGLSGAMGWFVLPLVKPGLSEDVSLVLSTAVFMSGVILLAPRMFINLNLPDLVKLAEKDDVTSYVVMRSKMAKLLYWLFTPVILVSCVYTFLITSNNVEDISASLIMVCAVVCFGYVSQFGLLSSMMLNVSEKSRTVVKISIVYFVALMGTTLLLTLVKINFSFYNLTLFYSGLALIALARNILLKRNVEKSFFNSQRELA